jgi:hypothetical protein
MARMRADEIGIAGWFVGIWSFGFEHRILGFSKLIVRRWPERVGVREKTGRVFTPGYDKWGV